MTVGSDNQGVGELLTAIEVTYDLSQDIAQFTRPGDTAKWFKADSKKMPGRRFVFPVYTSPISSARMSDFATAHDGPFPNAGDLAHEFMSYDHTDMSLVQASVKVNQLDLDRLDGSEDALYDLADRLFSETQDDISGRINNAVHQNTNCQMATVGTKYTSAGGTPYSQNRYCYISIAGGSISQFFKGMALTIHSVAFTVSAVIAGPDGPWRSGVRTSGIGPGLVLDSGSGNNCDDVTAADGIALSGEGSGDSFAGMPAWFGTTDVYNDEDGAAIDRDSIGYEWSIPHIHTAAASGSEVTLDLDAHIGKLCDTLSFAVNSGRKLRRSKGVSVSNALLAVGAPDLIVEASREGYAAGRFMTALASSEGDAKTRELYAQIGFNGAVYHHPVIGYVAFQPDKVSQPYKLRILDQAAWHWLEDGPGHGGVKWLNTGAGRWAPVTDPNSDNRQTFNLQAGCYAKMLLYCDQCMAQAEVTGVKSSI